MKNLLLPIFISLLVFSSCNDVIIDSDIIYTEIERAYFEGQKDAINGDVRIKKSNDNCWVWSKSCWDNGRIPIFNPSIVCDTTILNQSDYEKIYNDFEY